MSLEFLKSPWVWGGGILLGVVLLSSRSGGGNGGAATYTLGSMVEMNRAAMELTARQDSNAKDKAIAFAEKDKGITLGLFNLINSMNQTSAVQQMKNAEIHAGVTNARIQSYSFLEADKRANATRRYLAQLDYGVQIKALNTQKSMAKMSADTDLWKTVVGAGAAITSTGIKAAFGAV